MSLAPLFARAGHTPRPRGPRPAAGLLLRALDTDGHHYVLLGRRHRTLGGTWANFGGSLNTGEAPLAGALRELTEETGISAGDLDGARIAHVIDCGTYDIPYTLFVVDVPADVFDLDANLAWEHTDIMWCRDDAVADLRLHAGFRRGWEALP